MEKGDISNKVEARLLVVFEGLLGILPIEKQREESLFIRLRRWNRAVNLYEINEMMGRHIWDQTKRYSRQVDVITYKGVEFAEAVEKWVDDQMLPVGRVWTTEPHLLARSISWQPAIAAIYDPDPSHQLTYGSKGRYLDPENLRGFGT